jgi:uncharacterized RmlC-like cupin family protein
MSDPVRVVGDAQLKEAQGTPGLIRRVAFEGDGHWFGHAEAAPEMMSGWHHHGDNVTIGYVLKGQFTFEFGPGGTQRVEVHAGEYFQVPSHTVHREGNMFSTPGEVVIVRVGQGPVVFPVDGPEPG